MSILSSVIKSQIKRRGLIGLLVKVGDTVVKVTKDKKDDEIWNKIKQFINEVK